jgi:hypothetical protein
VRALKRSDALMSQKRNDVYGGYFDMRLIICAIFLLALFSPVNAYAVGVGDKAPDFKIITTVGKEISYARDFRDQKPVYLIFWATW